LKINLQIRLEFYRKALKETLVLLETVSFDSQDEALEKDPNIAQAVHSYRAEEDGHLEFKRGDTITITERKGKDLEDGWVQGTLNGRSGIFPLQYVSLNDLPSDESSEDSVSKPQLPKGGIMKSAFSYLPPGGITPEDIPVLRKREPALIIKDDAQCVASACQTCGCSDFTQNVFKPGSCNNCFHKHV
jgi:hypothetical protein